MASQSDRIRLIIAQEDLEGIEAHEGDVIDSGGDGIEYGRPIFQSRADAVAARDRSPQGAGAKNA